jgi:hypothetical protein
MAQIADTKASSTKAMLIIFTMAICTIWMDQKLKNILCPWMPTTLQTAPPAIHVMLTMLHTNTAPIADIKLCPMATMSITLSMVTFTIPTMVIAITMVKFNLRRNVKTLKKALGGTPGAFLFLLFFFRGSEHFLECFFNAFCDFI